MKLKKVWAVLGVTMFILLLGIVMVMSTSSLNVHTPELYCNNVTGNFSACENQSTIYLNTSQVCTKNNSLCLTSFSGYNVTSQLDQRYLYTNTTVCYTNGTSCPASNGNSSWNQSYADTIYYPRTTNPQAFYNATTLPTYPIGDNQSWNQTYASTLYYSISNPSGYISSYVETDPVWVSQRASYALLSQLNSNNNLSLAQISANIGNWTSDRQNYVNYTSFLSIGNWTQDKTSYTLLSQLPGAIGQNLTHALVVQAEGNWSLDKSSYYTITQVNNIEAGQNNFSLAQIGSNIGNWSRDSQNGLNNLSLKNVSDNIGNWSLDKSSYYTITSINNIEAGQNNLSLSQIVTNIGNWSQDKSSYTLLSQLPGAVGQNLTHALIVQAEGNWSLDKTSYALLSQLNGGVGQNLTHALVVQAEGNWSLDKASYYTQTQINNNFAGQNNLSHALIVQAEGNWSLDKVGYSTTTVSNQNYLGINFGGWVNNSLNVLVMNRNSSNISINYGALFVNTAQNRTGIGINNPGSALDVSGTINATAYKQGTNNLLTDGGFDAGNITSGIISTNRLPLNNITFVQGYTDFITLTGATTGSFSTADTVGRCTTFRVDVQRQAVFNNITLWVQTINNSVGVYFGIYNCTAGNLVNCTSGSLLINGTSTTTTNRTGLVGFQNLTGSWTLPAGTYLSCMTSNFSNAIASYRAATLTTGMPGACSFSTKNGGMPTTATLNCTAAAPPFTWLYS